MLNEPSFLLDAQKQKQRGVPPWKVARQISVRQSKHFTLKDLIIILLVPSVPDPAISLSLPTFDNLPSKYTGSTGAKLVSLETQNQIYTT